MAAAVRAGALAFAAVFAAGFVLGALRVVLLVPRLGEVGAVLIELPLMLAIAWVAVSRTVAALAVPPRVAARAAMGAVALGLLLAAEVALGVALTGRGAAEVVAGMAAPAGLIGLAGQAAFGLMPLWLLLRSGR